MKKIYLSLFILLFVGCTNANQIHKTNQPSIKQQKIDAQNSWDELDGKQPSIQNNSNIIEKKNEIISKPIKSKLETSNNIPNWFYSPPQSKSYFYGAGEGSNTSQAQASALDFIARQIQTTISSNLNISQGYNTSNKTSSFYQNINNNIHTEVNKINFTNIEIIKTLKVKNKIYILVRINKKQLFNSLKTNFQLLDSEIDNNIKNLKNYSLLEKLITLNKLKPKINHALSQANILYILNPDFNIQKYSNKYTNYLNQKNTLLHKLSFKVIPNNMFSQKLIEILNNNGYKISNHSNIIIKLSKNIVNSKTMGIAISRVTINIQIISKNKILKSNSITVKGVGNTYSQALEKAAINFKYKLKKIGINQLLNL